MRRKFFPYAVNFSWYTRISSSVQGRMNFSASCSALGSSTRPFRLSKIAMRLSCSSKIISGTLQSVFNSSLRCNALIICISSYSDRATPSERPKPKPGAPYNPPTPPAPICWFRESDRFLEEDEGPPPMPVMPRRLPFCAKRSLRSFSAALNINDTRHRSRYFKYCNANVYSYSLNFFFRLRKTFIICSRTFPRFFSSFSSS